MTAPWVVLSDGARPTEDIYLLASAAQGLRAAGIGCRRVRAVPWRVPPRLAARLRRSALRGANLVICRSLPEPWIEQLERMRRTLGRIVYVVDDDIPAAAASARLPPAYAERMRRVAVEQQPRLLRLADTVVVTSRALSERYAEAHDDVRLLEPLLTTGLPGTDHFAAPEWRLGFHGTRAHRHDLDRIAPALARLHDEQPAVHLELMLGRHAPAVLRARERVQCPAPRPWARFKALLGTPHLHIGLVPLLDDPFNRAKSWVKFLDIAAMGGVGVFSNRATYTEVVAHGVDGLLADDTAESWHGCLLRLLEHPADARAMAMRAQQKARQLGDPDRAVRFWRALS